MAILVGLALALIACVGAAWSGMDRDRALYPTLLIVIATYYVLFAVQDGRGPVLVRETALAMMFSMLALAAFRQRPWLVVAGLVAHGVLDLVHDSIVQDAGVPYFWPNFCFAFDLTAALFVAFVVGRRRW